MGELTGNLLVAQSGGPSPVINASLAGVITEALQYEDNIVEIYGGLNGIQGILTEQLIDLAAESQQTVRGLRTTPGAALGTCRYKMKKQQDLDRILDVFAAHDIRYFLYIGGNDSQDTAAKINALAIERGYDLRVIGVPKTIDNDLPVTDHCPGYGSVIKHIAATVREMSIDNAAMGQHDFVSILEVMGRNAGWLAAGATLAKRRNMQNEDAPHIILLPEVPFDEPAFVGAVQNVLRKQKHCFVVVSEGLTDADGNFLGADDSRPDAFGHAVLGGVGEYLRAIVEKNLEGVKARSAKLGISQRAAARSASLSDTDEAFLVGKEAVKAAVNGETGKMVVLVRESRDQYGSKTELASLEEIANGVKKFPAAWIGEDKMSIGYQFAKYAQPLIQGEVTLPYEGGLPKFAQLTGEKIPRKLDAYEVTK